MNFFRRIVAFAHSIQLEILLFLAVALLITQLCGPSILRWWQLPSPGTIGIDRFECATLAQDFLIYLPADYCNSQTWPLIVFLHGSGERGTDPGKLREWGPFHERPLAIIAAPQCLPSFGWEPDKVVAFVNHVVSKYHADRQRIYLMGYSMGANGTWQTALAHPELFAAIVPICGEGEPKNAKALVNLSVWAFHGAQDDAVPVEESERMIQAIREAGGKPRLTIIPDAGHGICNTVCARTDLWTWLLEQGRSK